VRYSTNILIEISLIFLLVFFIFSPVIFSQAPPTPVWPTVWSTPPCNTDPSDESPSQLDIISIDIVGDGYHPAVYYANDSNFLYLRERVEGDPNGPPGMFTQHNWVVVVEQTGDNYYDYLFTLNGKDEKVQIWNNTVKSAVIDWDPIFNDPAETLIWNGSTSVYARIDTDGTGHWFVSWAIPKTVSNFALGLNPTLYFATSADANNYNKDHLDCYEEPYCGDGSVNPPEVCELPNTFNNTYCSQTTQECSGFKLGTRDAYGNCNSICGCAYDLFTYQCVEGQCGATCDNNEDCQNKCVANVRYYNGNCDLVSTCSCSYSTEDCDLQDGCYAYETGCEDRDYYCTPGSCDYTYSNRSIDYFDDWVYYCDGLEYKRHKLFHDFYCDGTCLDHTSWQNEELVQDCDDGNECTYDYCDAGRGCSNPPKEYGTECGEFRDCTDDQCLGYFAYFYPDDGHDYCDGSGTCLVYSCDLEDSYCTDDDPFDGINYLTCGAPCDQDLDCNQTTSYCDYTTKQYCTRDDYGTCDENCECVEDNWSCNSADYCLYCNHCGDGVVNCGEECEIGQTDKRCLPEGAVIYYCINTTSYETPEFDTCNENCEWNNCTEIVTENDERCVPLPLPTCGWGNLASCFSWNRPSFNYQIPSFNFPRPSFNFPKPTFSSFYNR